MTDTIFVPTNLHEDGTQSADIQTTPHEDKVGCEMHVLPSKVIPVIFLPGIMGSNLKLSPARQQKLEKDTDISWRPEATLETLAMINDDPAARQQILDPEQTDVDTYDPGNPQSDKRHKNVSKVAFIYNPNDVEGTKDATHRARQRGWSEIFYESYGELLRRLEAHLNPLCQLGQPAAGWQQILDNDPGTWGATSTGQALTRDDLKKITDAWYPVHAMGYNWLRSNGDSAKVLGQRIRDLIAKYQSLNFKCEKVIVVTHSMGGLVGRALIHPDFGNAEDVVAGIIHGAMPATGAAAAYKRIRAGFEGGGVKGYIFKKVVGDTGPKVTAVLANAPGGLQLLPSERYGSDWLKTRIGDQEVTLGPNTGDPYADIYTVQDKWYRLINPEWVNPAKLTTSDLEMTFRKLKEARKFHQAIATHYHPQTYLSYGADANDKKHFAWGDVVWEVGKAPFFGGGAKQGLGLEKLDVAPQPEQWQNLEDKGEGVIRLTDGLDTQRFGVRIEPPAEAGDGTVPKRSAVDPVDQGKPKLSFKGGGYEHQDSYKDQAVLNSTLYGIASIARDGFTWWSK